MPYTSKLPRKKFTLFYKIYYQTFFSGQYSVLTHSQTTHTTMSQNVGIRFVTRVNQKKKRSFFWDLENEFKFLFCLYLDCSKDFISGTWNPKLGRSLVLSKAGSNTDNKICNLIFSLGQIHWCQYDVTIHPKSAGAWLRKGVKHKLFKRAHVLALSHIHSKLKILSQFRFAMS